MTIDATHDQTRSADTLQLTLELCSDEKLYEQFIKSEAAKIDEKLSTLDKTTILTLFGLYNPTEKIEKTTLESMETARELSRIVDVYTGNWRDSQVDLCLFRRLGPMNFIGLS
jgi:hypothetical protein